MEQVSEKTIVKLDLNNRTAKNLAAFAKEHPFLNVYIHIKPYEEDQELDVDLMRVEFHTHRCSKAEANRRFFYFFIIYSEWLQIQQSN